MPATSHKVRTTLTVVGFMLLGAAAVRGQDAGEPPPVPKGVDVLARGPVHEAFASLTADPQETPLIPKHPPKPIEELPPEEKPDGDVIWIPGYWHWDDERKDFLWVSGIWRAPPPGKRWVAGYWRDVGDQSQWVPGFWQADETQQQQQPAAEATSQVTYLPQPPAPPEVAAPGAPPAADTFYVPGTWVWTGTTYAWRAGYWAHVQPGYVWVPAHYRWTPSGYVYIPGYWDLTVAQRGVLYAPVYVDPAVVTVGFVYTPAYVVSDTVVVDALFVRPCCCHYYFGDYYGPAYHEFGFEACVVYSRHHYDGIYVYAAYEHRDEPNWINLQVNVYNNRYSGVAPRPPRTLVQQTTIINNVNINNVNVNNVHNTTVLMTSKQYAQTRNVSMVHLDPAARTEVRQHAQAVQQVSYQRARSEVAVPRGAAIQPHTAALSVPKPHPVAAARTAPGVAAAAGAGHKLGVPVAPQGGHTAGASGVTHPGTPAAGHAASPYSPAHATPDARTAPSPHGTAPPPRSAMGSGPGAVHPGMAPGTPGYPGRPQPGQPGQPGRPLPPGARPPQHQQEPPPRRQPPGHKDNPDPFGR